MLQVSVATGEEGTPGKADTGGTRVPPVMAPESGGDATQQIVNDPLVKRAVELFQGRIVHVEPWSRQ